MPKQPPGPAAIDRAFGTVLKELRLETGISQERLGLDIDSGRTFISELERGKRGASLKTLFRLAARLDVPPSMIVARIEAQLSRSKRH